MKSWFPKTRSSFSTTHNSRFKLLLQKVTIVEASLVVWLLVLSAGNGFALDHSGEIQSDETWLAADNPHVIVNHLFLNSGVTLTIEPGVEIFINAGRRLYFYGNLTAVGLPGQEILFTRNTASNWGYIWFLHDAAGTFEYCTIEHSDHGIFGDGSGTITVSNVTFRDNVNGINSPSSTLSVSDCLFQDNTTGLYAWGGTVELASTTFTGNTTYGFYGIGVGPSLPGGGLVFNDNDTGIRVDDVPNLNLTSSMTVTGSTRVGIHLKNCDGPTIDNLVLTGNSSFLGGLVLEDCGDFTLGAGNTIGGPGLENSWPLSILSGSYPSAASVIPATGNTNNDIQVIGGISDKSGTWRRFTDLDYIVTESPHFAAGSELVIEPGVTIRLDYGQSIAIYGTLTAVGLPGLEILFTQNTDQLWGKIQLWSGSSGTFEYCTIEHANEGIAGLGGPGPHVVSNLIFQDNHFGLKNYSTLLLSDCLFQNNSIGLFSEGGTVQLASTTFSGNKQYGFFGNNVGLWLLDSALEFTDNFIGFQALHVPSLSLTSPMTLTGNTFAGIILENCDGPTVDNQVLTGNEGTMGALAILDCGDFTLGANNTIGGPDLENSWPLTIGAGSYASASSVIPTTGNNNNDIQVIGYSSNKTGIWRKFTDLDYIVTASTFVRGELIIEPGVNLLFNPGKSLAIYGTLTAVGLPGQEVLFTSNSPSNWDRIAFFSGGGGTFEYCTIEHSNNGIYTTGAGTISVMGSVVKNNLYGVRATDGTLNFRTTQIINNTEYGIYLDGAIAAFGNSLSEWNDIYGNGSGEPGRDLFNGELDIDARYVHWGTMDYSQILTQIWDSHDDGELGYVQTLPYVNSSHDGEATDVDEPRPDRKIPVAFGLFQNAPNPFNPSTVIRFDLTQTAPVTMKVFDVTGALVATLVDTSLPAGHHRVVWMGKDDQGRTVPSGVYLYRIATGDHIETREMLLLK